jgi:23S rRNA (uracil1939-C5)-methyltransferase
VSEGEAIVRVAAKGDGVTAAGRHVRLAAPGDRLLADGSLAPGPFRAVPPCRHFPECGGCQLQHLDDEALRAFVRERVVNAAAGQGLAADSVAEPHLSPPCSRRRATLHAERRGGRMLLGFREEGTHRIVEMRECHVLRPELFGLVAPLRRLLERWPQRRLAVDVGLTLADQGLDCTLKGVTAEGLEQTEALLAFARDNGLARLSLDSGFGAETVWEPEPATVSFSGIAVPLPPGGFLQATADGEAALAGAARDWLGGAPGLLADLFSGLGAFDFALAGPAKVLAVEAGRAAHLACAGAARRAGRPVHALHRDLYRNPLRVEELDRFAGVVLDPPRAGAREQVEQLAASKVPRIVYVSCNPASWARDAARLVAGGYRLEELRPVGQFRWSTHVELASLFVR